MDRVFLFLWSLSLSASHPSLPLFATLGQICCAGLDLPSAALPPLLSALHWAKSACRLPYLPPLSPLHRVRSAGCPSSPRARSAAAGSDLLVAALLPLSLLFIGLGLLLAPLPLTLLFIGPDQPASWPSSPMKEVACGHIWRGRQIERDRGGREGGRQMKSDLGTDCRDYFSKSRSRESQKEISFSAV